MSFVILPGLSKYEIHDDGQIISRWFSKPKSLSGRKSGNGYINHTLVCDDGVVRAYSRHALVCTAFHGPCPSGLEARHRDGRQSNNAADNLSWATHLVNIRDKVTHGTERYGDDHPKAKLTCERVRFIRANPDITLTALAARFEVTKTCILHVRKRVTWQHVL